MLTAKMPEFWHLVVKQDKQSAKQVVKNRFGYKAGALLGMIMSKRGKNFAKDFAKKSAWFGIVGPQILRAGIGAGVLALAAACTTIEGGNAFVDRETFGREVIDATAIGLGLKAPEYKDIPANERAPLVLPQLGGVSAPTQGRAAELPEDSDGVIIDPDKVTPQMVRRIRQARVIDGIDVSGDRPLTPAELKFISERVRQARLTFQQSRDVSLFEPPKTYFTTIGGKDFICLAADGELVLFDDPKCPPDIRAALANVRAEEKAREKALEAQFEKNK